MSDTQHIIKKYSNRRLYDAARSRYITLQDIKALVFSHTPFKVVDANSGENITESILLQIIMAEEENQPNSLFTQQTLLDLICAYQDSSKDAMRRYLEYSTDAFKQQFDLLQNPLANPGAQALSHSLTEMAEKNLAFWQDFLQPKSAGSKSTT